MLTKLTSEKQMKFLCFLCCLAYFMSYLTRINYAACMVELQSALQIGKSIAGLPVTACFLSYGLGQIICGFLGDKMKPQLMIFAGLAGVCACNLTVALIPRMEVITPVWCANGFFQAMLWPPHGADHGRMPQRQMVQTLLRAGVHGVLRSHHRHLHTHARVHPTVRLAVRLLPPGGPGSGCRRHMAGKYPQAHIRRASAGGGSGL